MKAPPRRQSEFSRQALAVTDTDAGRMLPADFHYERFAPSPALAGYVEHFWIVNATTGEVARRDILIPNGRPTILLCLGDPGVRLDPRDGRRQPNGSALNGIGTRPVILEQSGHSRYLGAQLTPFGLAGFVPESLIDAAMPLAAWLGANEAATLLTAVRQAEFGRPAARTFERALEARFTALAPPRFGRLQRAVAAIDAARGMIDVVELCRQCEVGYDRLYRDFRDAVGLPPKQLIAITRYQNFVGQLLVASPGTGGLAQLALMQGYYDQAHASREFRKFTGVTQLTFRDTLNGIARLMHRD